MPVLSNRQACGPRHQVRHGVDGSVIGNPEDVDELANELDNVVQRRLVFGQDAGRFLAHQVLVGICCKLG